MSTQTIKVGGMTITIDTTQEIVFTAELVLGILIAIEPWLALPVWLVVLLPILRADLPLAQLLFNSLESYFQKVVRPEVTKADIIGHLKKWLEEQEKIAANTPPWPT